MKREEIPPDMQGRVISLLRVYLAAVFVAGAQLADPDGLPDLNAYGVVDVQSSDRAQFRAS